MPSKRKKNPNQPELPIQEVPDNTPGEVHAAPTPPNGKTESKPVANGNGNGDHSRDEHIFVCGVVNNGVASGKIDPLSAADIAGAAQAASAAYQVWRKEQ